MQHVGATYSERREAGSRMTGLVILQHRVRAGGLALGLRQLKQKLDRGGL